MELDEEYAQETTGGETTEDDVDVNDGAEGLTLALDAREMGNEARWARSGCFPNAVVRPVLGLAPASSAPRLKKGGEAELSLGWAIFSTRPIAPRGEEIVVGWEWDKASAVHRLRKILNEGCSDANDE
jgi:hypothetical protein